MKGVTMDFPFNFLVYGYATFSSFVTTVQLIYKPGYIRQSLDALVEGKEAFDNEI